MSAVVAWRLLIGSNQCHLLDEYTPPQRPHRLGINRVCEHDTVAYIYSCLLETQQLVAFAMALSNACTLVRAVTSRFHVHVDEHYMRQ